MQSEREETNKREETTEKTKKTSERLVIGLY
jgi:hypothetical protein